jgi:hypothetical protein
MARKLTKAKFKAWLGSKHPRTKIGKPGMCTTCPIAKFLTQTTKEKGRWGVTDDTCVSGGVVITTPNWAAKFIYRVDDLPDYSYVTAKKCLEILATC